MKFNAFEGKFAPAFSINKYRFKQYFASWRDKGAGRMAGSTESVGKQLIIIAILGALGVVLLGISQRADVYFKRNQANADTTIQQDSVKQAKR